MSRMSFGSRAGDVTDYGGGGGQATFMGPRQARVTGPYDSLEALIEALADEFKAAEESTLPVCTTIELCLGLNAVLPLVRPSIGPYAGGGDHDLPFEFKNGLYEIETGDDDDSEQRHPRAPCSAIINVVDPKAKQIVQRAASRGVIAAIEALDGFRYSFNNAWTAKDEEGARFSFICQDSMQNKDRHANGYTRILKHLKDPTGAERGPRKPTYDCKGSVSVKFSASRQRCDVYYRHNAIHDTVAARKPAPRATSGVKRTSSSWIKLSNSGAAVTSNFIPRGEEDTGGLSAMLQAESAKSKSPVIDSSPSVRPRPPSSNIGRPLKRKREDIDRPAPVPRQSNQPLSLADLLRQSETARAPPPSSDTRNTKTTPGAAAVAYDLPPWQTPPPPLNRPANGLPYQLPYQPQAPKVPVTALTSGGPTTPMPTSNPPVPPKNLQHFRATSAQKPGPGLFTTMKVVEKPPLRWSQPSYQTPPSTTQFITHSRPRSVLACTNCRLAKRRCDEGRPACAACSKTARTDCRYETPAHLQKQSASNHGQQPQQNDTTMPKQTEATSAQQPDPTTTNADTTSQQLQTPAIWSQNAPSSGQQTRQNWSETPLQQPSQTAWGTGSSMQQQSLSNWSQDPSSISSWPEMSTKSTNAQHNAKEHSPDPWYPKR
ncbi:Putative zn(2)-C6 fungal-type DNA-binding domain-containing protein [Septoria linicola]|uniref:Zn(2)-C6 fungal-type DNA-binding domain-containing protein n=1 Tax=Septoria linicola TaxID=215465 RepID=A0A9Q9ANH8_9PEZI|nr:putative zn(2)-C6 fungal-type DNA-binding domain-containing protein [Septoria linicola]USW52549.1 Putative zn(2)-C6 fungal-type DNA-binding domain-containing protein [Septoria linicola]